MSAPDCIAEYLRLYGSALGERVLSQFPPLHNPDDPISPWLHQLKRRPFPAQVLAILGIVKRFQTARCAAAAVTFSKSWPARPYFGLTGPGQVMV
jgi:hypothetical protein